MSESKAFARLVEEGAPTAEVLSLNNFMATITTLPGALVNATVLFANGAEALVWRINRTTIDVLLLNDNAVHANEMVVLFKSQLTLPVSKKLLGRIINPLGKPLDGKGFLYSKDEVEYFKNAPGLSARDAVKEPLESGVTVVDTLFPLAKGQRMAVMGDSKSGKTSFMIQTAIHQARAGQTVIYVLISKSRNELNRIVHAFDKAKVRNKVVLVVADVTEPLAVGFLGPYAGCAIGEYFWYAGKDVTVVYDDFTNHAKIYREMALLMGQSVGREAYPGDMFHVHAALLERAGKLKETSSSLSVLVAGSTPNNDLSDFQSTRLISMSDGQIVFDISSLHEGNKPAINIDLSVSRIGGGNNNYLDSGVTDAVKKALGRFKQAKAMTSFIEQVSEVSRLDVALGNRLTEAMQQQPDEFYSFPQQRLLLKAILDNPNPASLNVIWLKDQVQAIKQSRTYNNKDIDSIKDKLIKKAQKQ